MLLEVGRTTLDLLGLYSHVRRSLHERATFRTADSNAKQVVVRASSILKPGNDVCWLSHGAVGVMTVQDGWHTLDHESKVRTWIFLGIFSFRIGTTSSMKPKVDFDRGPSRHLQETRASPFPSVTETVGWKETTCRGGRNRCFERSEGVKEQDGSTSRHRTGGIGGHGTGETKEQVMVCQPRRTALVRGSTRC